MATNYEKTCENENYGGMCRMYVDLYRDLLWAVFIDKIPIPVLVSRLANILATAHTFKPFLHQFKRLLNVHASTGTIKNTDCDISVIYSLFRNIPTTFVPPTHGWGNVPQSGDVLVTDDLERIHHGRNELIGHAGEASITDADFNNQLYDIKNIVTRLDIHLGSSYLPHLLQIESDCQSSKGHLNHYDEYIKELKRQQDAEADLKALVEENKKAIGDVSSQFDNKVEELDTKIVAHDKKFAAQDTECAAHDTKLEEHASKFAVHDTKFKDHDTKFEDHDSKFAVHDTKFKDHDTKFSVHDTTFKDHDTKFEDHASKFAVHNTKFKDHDIKFEDHDSKFAVHDTKFKDHDTKFAVHDTTFKDHDTKFEDHASKFAVHDTKFKDHDTKFEDHDSKFAVHDTKFKDHDTKFEDQIRNLKTKEEEQEQINSIVQHTHEEHSQEREEDRRRLTALEGSHEKETQEKQKRAKDVLAGQDKLKNCLLEQYREQILRKEPNVWFSMKDVLQMVVPLDIREDLEQWMALSRTDRKRKITSKARNGTKIKTKREMFFKGEERQYEIYLLGEAGVGKSTFCHQLIDNWCKVQDTESNDGYLHELKSFPFLFFIQARHAKTSQSVYEMIQTQNCPLKFRSILMEVFSSHPENCLVLIDGLDEWQSDTRGYQELPNVTEIKGSTILITSRQWKIEALDCELPSSCRVLEIRGLDSNGIENLAGKALETFTRDDHQCSDCESLVKQFLDQIYALELDNLAKIPLILLILIRSWLDGNRKLENALGFIYSGLIESLLIHSNKKVELSKTWGDSTNTNTLPMCFFEKSNCLHYNSLLNELTRLAFDHLFSAEKENTLVIRKYDLAKKPKVEEHLQMCLKLGLLIESKDFSETNECHRAYTFPHKTIQEFFCAVYLSGEEFETGLAKFCERVTSPVDVFEFENVVLFLSGMNLTHCKKLFEYICSIVFGRNFANPLLYPEGWFMIDKIEKIKKLAENCTAEARHSVPEASHTGESAFVIPDMLVDDDTPEHNEYTDEHNEYTPEHKLGQLCRLGPSIKSLVYAYFGLINTVTPFSIVESIRTMHNIQRLGIGCTVENTDKYIACICKYLSNLHQLKSFSFSVVHDTLRLSIHASTELVSKLVTLPNLVSVYLQSLDLPDIETCQFTSQLTSLGLNTTKSLSPVVSGWCKQLHTLHMDDVDLSPETVHQLCQYLMTSSSLQSLVLSLPDLYNTPGYMPAYYVYTCFDDVLDLTTHTSLHTLEMKYIDLESGMRIQPGHNSWRKIDMSFVSMSESMWQEFIYNLPTEPLQQLHVTLWYVKSLNTQTLSYIRDNFYVTLDYIDGHHLDSDDTDRDDTDSDSTNSESTDSDRKYISFNTKH